MRLSRNNFQKVTKSTRSRRGPVDTSPDARAAGPGGPERERAGAALARRRGRRPARVSRTSNFQPSAENLGHCILHTIFHVLTEQYHVHTTTGSRVLGARIRSSSQIARMTSAFAVLPMLSVFVVNANERPASGRVRVRVRSWVWVWVWARVRVRLGYCTVRVRVRVRVRVGFGLGS